MAKLEADIYNNAVEQDKIAEVKEKIQNLNDKQQSIKIMINSVYGILSTPFSPVYNPYISQSITRLGKFLNISSSEFIKKWLKENYNIDDDYIVSISGDTDSAVSPALVRIQKTQ
jgi:DNA polymerase elongation subunit (family B)